VAKSSNNSKDLSSKLWPLLVALIGIFAVVLILVFVFKRLMNKQTVDIRANA
jgi:flagellar biogenesis protein FliO